MLAEYPSLDKNSTPRIKIRICKKCNERMGTQIEVPAAVLLKPLFTGAESVVKIDQQQILAKWIFKVSLLEAFASSRPDNWGYSNLRQILHKLVIADQIPSCMVRLGTRHLDDEEDALPRRYTGDLLPVTQMPRSAYFAVSTHLHLVWELVVGVDREISGFARRTDSKTRWLQRVWPPPGGSVDLSQTEPLALGQIEAMRHDFMSNRKLHPNLAHPRRRNY